jgi:hypothetical protein
MYKNRGCEGGWERERERGGRIGNNWNRRKAEERKFMAEVRWAVRFNKANSQGRWGSRRARGRGRE